MKKITVQSPDGGTVPLTATRWAPLADVMRTVAAGRGGEERLYEWCLPVHRPPVDDVRVSAREILLEVFQ